MSATEAGPAAARGAGAALHAFASELYPICRSITGNGVRETLRRIGRRIPLETTEVPSGAQVFDWEVPLEWNVEDAWIKDPDGRPVVEFARHNLHVMSYSEPVHAQLALDELRPKLHSIPDRPDWIPYRTSYYKRQWGFCLRHRDLEGLRPGRYEVHMGTSLEPGSLTYAELVHRGRSRDEVLFFTHVCHPSLANDNASGMAVATELAAWVAAEPRRYTYRFVFAPGTIGSLCWLKANEQRLGRVRHGLVLGLLGDGAALTYKQSRLGDRDIDRIVSYVLTRPEAGHRVIPFEPYGYDERQLCSPGFDLPVGRLTRSVNGGYPQYHSSADDLELIGARQLEESLETLKRVIEVIETDRRYLNLSPKGEPRLGKRGLYGSVGGRSPADSERALLWVLSQSDGRSSLLDIAMRSGVDHAELHGAALRLQDAGLVEPLGDAAAQGRSRRNSKAGHK